MAAPPANAAAPVPVTRIAGANRFGTAAAIAEKAFPAGASTVIVATGFNFPDALAGNYLAGVDKAPILLVNVDNVPSETSAALQTLKAKNVIILGQTEAVDTNTENQLKSAGYTTSRIGGPTRLETAQMIDEAPNATTIGTVNGKKTALLARADNFPDALGGGPVAYAKNFPVILTATDSLSPQAQDVITKDGIQQVIILGGPLAISSATESQANAAGAATLFRANGVDRSDTSRLLGEYELSNLGFVNTSYGIASGDQGFTGADALASGPFSGGIPQPTLVTNSINDPGQLVKWGQAHNATATTCYAFGGPIPLPDSTVNAVCNATSTNAAGVTTLPELVGAQIIGTTTTANVTPTTPAGTVVRYVFDEPINGATPPVPADFKVYNYTNSNTPADTGTSATVDPNANNAVFVNFPNLNTATLAQNLTVATVVPGAVTDLQGQTNPEGDATIGTARTFGGTSSGVTAAPNLESVGNFRQALTAGQTAVDFVFDQAVTTNAATGFSIVLTDGTENACASPAVGSTTPNGTSPGGNGTTTITVTCADAAATPTTPFTAAQVARGVVAPSTVKAFAAPNTVAAFLQASDAPHSGSGNPTLTNVTLQPAAAGAPANSDAILYTFDQAVNPGVTATSFGAVLANGTQVAGVTATRSTANASQVLVTFPNGTDANTVSGNVAASAVTPVTPTVVNHNQDDELAASNATSTTTTTVPGSTTGPDLTGVALTANKDPFGTVTGYSATYTFTTKIASAVPGNFFLYDSDGTKLTCAAIATISTTTPPNSVTCTSWTTGTLNQQTQAVLGTVAAHAVTDVNGNMNTEDAEPTTGGTGTPQQG